MGLVLAALHLAAPAPAQPAASPLKVFRFLPPDEVVEGYRFYFLDEPSGREIAFDVGPRTPGADGVAEVALSLFARDAYRVQMTAYNAYGESPRSNVIRVAPPPTRPVRVVGVTPQPVGPGTHTLLVTGEGFVSQPEAHWENGTGKLPRTRSVRVMGENLLEVKVKVKRKFLEGPTSWDLWLVFDDGRLAVVPDALQVDPGL